MSRAFLAGSRHALAAGLVALMAAVPACNAGSADPAPVLRSGREPPRDAAPDADLGRLAGKPLYRALCAPCHGPEARGYAADHAPSLVSPTFLETASDDFLRRSIAAGRPGTSMAAYARERGGPLDAAAIDRLVGFLRELGPAPHASPAPDLPVAPRADLPVAPRAAAGGDPSIGAALYTKHCATCHGDQGRRGEAVWLANPELLAVASDAFLRHAIAHGRPGTKMEPFAGKLTDAEIDGVVSFLRMAAGGAPAIQLLPPPTGKEPLVLNPGGKTPRFTLRADPCPPAVPGAPPCKQDPRYVSIDQVAAAYAARQRMVIIDARPPSEWMRVHITGAVSIPYHDMKRLDEAPRDGTWVIAYCACPHHLSGIVVDELRKRGYAHAVVLDEGINEWHRRGLPVTTAEGVPRPLPEPSAPPGGPR